MNDRQIAKLARQIVDREVRQLEENRRRMLHEERLVAAIRAERERRGVTR